MSFNNFNFSYGVVGGWYEEFISINFIFLNAEIAADKR